MPNRWAELPGRASTINHIVPHSQGGRFFDPANLEAACGACNYGQGAQIGADNKRERIEWLEALCTEQNNEIADLRMRLRAYENGSDPERSTTEPARPRQKPRIF